MPIGTKYKVSISADHITINDYFIQTVSIMGFPTEAVPGMIRSIIPDYEDSEEISINYSLRFTPSDIKFNFLTDIKINRLDKSISLATSSGKASDEANHAEVNALESLLYLKKNRQRVKYHDVWFSITASSKDLNVLRTFIENLKDMLENYNFTVESLKKEQHSALSLSWAGKTGYIETSHFYKKYYGYTMDLPAIETLFPFLSGSISDGPQFAYIGHRYFERTAVCIDFENSPDAQNILFVGSSGAGKSYEMKTILGSLLGLGFKVYIFDVDGEYRDFCKDWGGIWVDQTIGSGRYIDPTRIRKALAYQVDFDQYDEKERRLIIEADLSRYSETCQAVKGTISLLAHDISTDEDSELDDAITLMFQKAGIEKLKPMSFDNVDFNYPEQIIPIYKSMKSWDNYNLGECSIHKLYTILKSMSDNNKDVAALVKRIRKFFDGTESDVFALEDSTEDLLNANLVVFHVANSVDNEIEQHMGAVKMAMAENAVWQMVKLERFKKECFTCVAWDELQRSLKNPYAASGVYKYATNARKFNSMIIGALNVPQLLFETETGKALWANSNYKIYLRLPRNVILKIADDAGLPPEAIKVWLSLKDYKYSFMFSKRDTHFDMLKSELPASESGSYETRGLKKSI